MPKQTEEYIDTKAVCSITGYCTRTVRRMVAEGTLTAFRMRKGGTLRFRRSQVIKRIEESEFGSRVQKRDASMMG